jgi:hypothetical protein
MDLSKTFKEQLHILRLEKLKSSVKQSIQGTWSMFTSGRETFWTSNIMASLLKIYLLLEMVIRVYNARYIICDCAITATRIVEAIFCEGTFV